MILKTLVICDVGPFQGRHVFDLTPKIRYGHPCPIILFGGLNGTGKTTVLMAIRLAFYGRQALGATVTKKDYHRYLGEIIHKNTVSLTVAKAAAVELTFSYAQQGEIHEYQVQRLWYYEQEEVREELKVYCDSAPVEEGTVEVQQKFLSELIPIGVAELFFFDSEKITALAEDESGEQLHHAIRRLLGLDIVERLRADLNTYVHRQHPVVLPDKLEQELGKLEQSYQSLLAQQSQEVLAVEEIDRELKVLANDIEQLENVINEAGGNYLKGVDRGQSRQTDLLAEKASLEDRLRINLGGAFPLSLLEKSLQHCHGCLKSEGEFEKQQRTEAFLQARLSVLQSRLMNVVPKKYEKAVFKVLEEVLVPGDLSSEKRKGTHLSASAIASLEHWISRVIPESASEFRKLREELRAVEQELGKLSKQLVQVPHSLTFQADVQILQEKSQQLGVLQTSRQYHRQKIRELLSQAIAVAEKQRKARDEVTRSWRINKAVLYASQARQLLEAFSNRTASRKALELERKFMGIFQHLFRKGLMNFQVHINPESFKVHWLDGQGQPVARRQWSAGESQIYALAILEALAKTSGRQFPIVIDAPLGKLDSQHRALLIKYYFPRASHQIILLSTDTEVDKDFYLLLSTAISHAFHLHYDPQKGYSQVEKGYFWRSEVKGHEG